MTHFRVINSYSFDQKKVQSNKSKFYDQRQKYKLGGSSFALLSLSACGGGGGGGDAAPGNNNPAPAPAPVAAFTETATNVFLADNDLDSTFADTTATADLRVTGRNGDDSISTGSGDDTVFGGGGLDTLSGGAGVDVLFGESGNDTLSGGADGDFLVGGLGADALDGGTGSDWADYTIATTGVTVNLATGVGSRGEANGDTYTSIENVNGSPQNDTITGDDNDNMIDGWGGVDTINGGGGDDSLFAWQVDSSHQDTFDGGTGEDTLFFVSNSTTVAYNIDLSTVDASNIEKISLDVNNTVDAREELTLTAQDVIDVTDGDNRLLIEGDTADRVTVTDNGWSQSADEVIGSVTYNVYTNGAATLLIDEDITQDISAPTLIGFSLVSADTYEADDDSDSTFSEVNSIADLSVTGRGGNDSITTGAGNDITWGGAGTDTINTGAGNDGVQGGAGADVMDGGAGDGDLLSYTDSTAGVTVSLATGTGSGGDAAGDTFSNFEDLLGSAHNDTLTGDANTNIIEGGAGADTLDGGAGSDILSYLLSSSGVDANLLTGVGAGGDAAGDSLANFENIMGSLFSDTLTGDAGANLILGLDGDDTLHGGGGDDFIDGGNNDDTINGDAGVDQLIGNTGNDTLNGGDGDDLIFGGAGNDTLNGDAGMDYFDADAGADAIDGGADVDLVDFSTSTSGVTVNLLAGTGSGGDAAGDTYANIENVYGTAFSDTITGDASDNLIDGYGGNDTISGGAGDDTFMAWQIDTPQNSSYDGGAGDDTLALIAAFGTTYVIDLSTLDVTNIENINLDHFDTDDRPEDLTLTAQDVLDVTDADDQLLIEGDTADSVTSTGQGWVQGADQVIDSVTYNTYTSGAATLLVDEDIAQTIS